MNNHIQKIIAVLLFCVTGGWVSRMAGGAKPKLPLGLDQWIYALPYGLICLPAGWWALAGYGGAFGGKRTGHGRGISLKEKMKESAEPEKLEYLILWLEDKMSTYWYKVLVLAITGLAVSLAAGVVVAVTMDLFWGVFLALSGLSKAPAYMIGWEIYPEGSDADPTDSELDEATEIGELLTGVFGFAACAIVYLNVF